MNEEIIKEFEQYLIDLNNNQVATTNKIDELTAYFIAKDKREQEEKEREENKEAEEKAIKEEEEQKQQEEIEQEEQQEEAEEQTISEILVDIKNEQIRTNEIFSGQLFFTGVIAGLLIGIILWNRIFKL